MRTAFFYVIEYIRRIKTMSRFLLPLCLSLALAAVAAGGVLEDTCKQTTVHYDYCVAALGAVPKSKNADAHGLAKIALKMAAKNATATAEFISKLHDKTTDHSGLEDCLAVCKEDYLDAVEELDDAVGALDKKKYNDVVGWVNAALEFVKYCQQQCHDVPEHKNVLTQRNKDFRTLCSITVSIARTLR